MKNELRGIALLLFGVIISLLGIVLSSALPGDYYILVSTLGVLLGTVGLVMVFRPNKPY